MKLEENLKMLDSDNNIAFLFGAGVSLPSGLPKTDELTDIVLKGENIVRISGKYFYSDNPEQFSYNYENEYVNRIKKLFHVLQNYFGNHYSFMNRRMNYEDYFYMIDSMHSDENMEFENPLVEYFSDHLFKVHSYLFEPLCDFYSSINLITLMSEAKNYIRDIVAFYLGKIPDNLCQFNLLNEVNADSNYHKIFVSTLNHDLLIEEFFLKNCIKFSEGFTDKNKETKVWDNEAFTDRFNLLKLHGSINWSRFDSNDPYEKKVCIYKSTRRTSGEESPVIIVGSFNKLKDYSHGAFFDLQCLFSEFLSYSDRLIISGYGFGDQGINSRIINWLYGSRDRKIIVIHKNEDELFRYSRPAINTVWENDKKDNTDLIRIIPKWIEETSWQEIRGILT